MTLESMWQDLRYAWRSLLRSPVFTLVAVTTLALGIGASTAVFSAVDRILLRQAPYPHAERLVSFGFAAPIEPIEFMLGTDWVEWRRSQSVFESMTSVAPGVADCDLTEQQPLRLGCAQVDAAFLPTLQVAPLLGRNFTADEDQPNASKAALISYALWRGHFGGDASIVGKTIVLDGQSAQVVGVLPESFEYPTLARPDILQPLALDLTRQVRPNTGRVLRSFARLKPEISAAQAAVALQPQFDESLKFVPPAFRKEVRLRVRSLRDRQVGDVQLASWVLLGSVMAVLLISIANVAGLLLARSIGRRRELAIRAALGAARSRLARQTLTESLLLGLAGGALGGAVAWALLRAFTALAPDGIPRLQQAGLDGRVLCFAVAMSVLSGILFGLAPAIQTPSAEMLTGAHVIGSSRSILRKLIVAGQFAASLLLLAGAGLLLRSLWNLENAPLGMQTASVVTTGISLGQYSYAAAPKRYAFFEELLARVRRLPGVEDVALSDSLPPSGSMRSRVFAAIEIEGRPRFDKGTGGMAGWRVVTPEYFSTLGIPLERGRSFQEQDRDPDENPVILSQTLARMLFAGEDPLGHKLRFGFEGPWFTVVGIAGNVKNGGITAPDDPEYYVVRRHLPDDAGNRGYLIARTTMRPEALENWIRSEVRALDPSLPITVETMQRRVGKLTVRPRFDAALLSIFAALGVLLAAIGIYGLMSFLVEQRQREIGIRMALGAQAPDIVRLIAGGGMRLVLFGAGVGLLASLAATRALGSLLFGVRPNDPVVLAEVVVGLALVALFATALPARRASKVDPMVALRHE